MKILLTGATGFIGSHLIKRLIDDRHTLHTIIRPQSNKDFPSEVSSYEFDGDINKIISYMQEQKFDGVIHLASLFLAKHEPIDIKGLIDSNVLFATNVLEAAVKSGVIWFLNTGTFWQHYKDADYSPVNLYAATKQAFEDIAQYYIETSNLNFVTIKLNDTFGPNDTRAKVMNLFNKAGQTGEKIEMSPGKQLMDINYIDNVTDGYVRMIHLLQNDKKKMMRGKSFAIKSSRRMNLQRLASLFEKVTGRKLNIDWGKKPYRPREVMVPWKKGVSIPGWKPKVSAEEGIRRTFIKNNNG